MLTGSLASAYYATPRATQDVDLVIEAGAEALGRAVVRLDKAGYYVDHGRDPGFVQRMGEREGESGRPFWAGRRLLTREIAASAHCVRSSESRRLDGNRRRFTRRRGGPAGNQWRRAGTGMALERRHGPDAATSFPILPIGRSQTRWRRTQNRARRRTSSMCRSRRSNATPPSGLPRTKDRMRRLAGSRHL